MSQISTVKNLDFTLTLSLKAKALKGDTHNPNFAENTMILMCCGLSAEYRISEMCFKKHNNIDVL